MSLGHLSLHSLSARVSGNTHAMPSPPKKVYCSSCEGRNHGVQKDCLELRDSVLGGFCFVMGLEVLLRKQNGAGFVGLRTVQGKLK